MTSRNADGSIAGTPVGIRVFPEGDVFVAANSGGWLEGTFASVPEAVAAAHAF